MLQYNYLFLGNLSKYIGSKYYVGKKIPGRKRWRKGGIEGGRNVRGVRDEGGDGEGLGGPAQWVCGPSELGRRVRAFRRAGAPLELDNTLLDDCCSPRP